jgi:type VI secretion system protein ImpK
MEGTAKSASFVELAAGILGLAFRVRQPGCQDDFVTLRAGALKLFEAFEARTKGLRLDAEDVAAAKYALAAFMDEAVLSSEWDGREGWADEPLQLRFFNDTVAGWVFFEKLDAIRAQDPPNVPLLELYHACLALGFRGRYGVEGTERLQALLKVVDGELDRAKPAQAGDISPSWKPPEEPGGTTEGVPRKLVYACCAVVGATIVGYGLLFLGLRL